MHLQMSGRMFENVLCTLSEIHLGLKMHMAIFHEILVASSKPFLCP